MFGITCSKSFIVPLTIATMKRDFHYQKRIGKALVRVGEEVGPEVAQA
jgi:hypothetical protein